MNNLLIYWRGILITLFITTEVFITAIFLNFGTFFEKIFLLKIVL